MQTCMHAWYGIMCVVLFSVQWFLTDRERFCGSKQALTPATLSGALAHHLVRSGLDYSGRSVPSFMASHQQILITLPE